MNRFEGDFQRASGYEDGYGGRGGWEPMSIFLSLCVSALGGYLLRESMLGTSGELLGDATWSCGEDPGGSAASWEEGGGAGQEQAERFLHLVQWTALTFCLPAWLFLCTMGLDRLILNAGRHHDGQCDGFVCCVSVLACPAILASTGLCLYIGAEVFGETGRSCEEGGGEMAHVVFVRVAAPSPASKILKEPAAQVTKVYVLACVVGLPCLCITAVA